LLDAMSRRFNDAPDHYKSVAQAMVHEWLERQRLDASKHHAPAHIEVRADGRAYVHLPEVNRGYAREESADRAGIAVDDPRLDDFIGVVNAVYTLLVVQPTFAPPTKAYATTPMTWAVPDSAVFAETTGRRTAAASAAGGGRKPRAKKPAAGRKPRAKKPARRAAAT
jgi:hypothetical protein